MLKNKCDHSYYMLAAKYPALEAVLENWIGQCMTISTDKTMEDKQSESCNDYERNWRIS